MIRCIRFRVYEKNTLKGFADLELTRVGLILRDCCWHQRGEQEWVSFPARPFEGDDGATHWQPLIEFAEGAQQAREQFRKQALDAIHEVVDEEGEQEEVS